MSFHTPEKQKRYGYEQDHCASPQETKPFIKRMSKGEYEKETHETTVLELSSLVQNLKTENDKVKKDKFGPYWKNLFLLGFFIGFIGVVLSFNWALPYCGKNRILGFELWCKNCPKNAVCGAFNVKNCLMGKVFKSQVCAPDATIFEASLTLQSIIEESTHQYKCLGGKEFGIGDDNLYIKFTEIYKRIESQSEKKSLFDRANELINENVDYFQIGYKKTSLFSFKYSSFLSCLTGSPKIRHFVSRVPGTDKKRTFYSFFYVFEVPSFLKSKKGTLGEKIWGVVYSPVRFVKYLVYVPVRFVKYVRDSIKRRFFMKKEKKNDTKDKEDVKNEKDVVPEEKKK